MFEIIALSMGLIALLIIILYRIQKKLAGNFLNETLSSPDVSGEEIYKPGDERRGQFWRSQAAPSDRMKQKVRKQNLIRG